jgi:hypothetical protein
VSATRTEGVRPWLVNTGGGVESQVTISRVCGWGLAGSWLESTTFQPGRDEDCGLGLMGWDGGAEERRGMVVEEVETSTLLESSVNL